MKQQITKPKKSPKKKKIVKVKNEIPYHYKPQNLTIDEWQAGLRKQFAIIQNFTVKNLGINPVYSDFEVFNPISKNTYKVAIRSEKPGLNFCSCPDFKVNLLGTCKHIEFMLHKINKSRKLKQIFKMGNIQNYSSISLKYGEDRKIYLRIGEINKAKIQRKAKRYFDDNNFLKENAFDKIDKFIEEVKILDPEFRLYSDALDFIIEVRSKNQRIKHLENKYKLGINSPELDNLINAKLYPYQKEGILFAAKAGRCLIADDMGLGKTIQAIAISEILANEFNIEKVLIVCPTSLKYQWKAEIEKFTNRSVLVVEGNALKRAEQFKQNEFFKITSYNSIKADFVKNNDFEPDLIILDEAQRIKNWKTKTAQNVKQLKSEFAIVLTGTPLENRLEELHSIVEFVDRYKLGALFRFLANHQLTEETGKVLGYHNLSKISKSLESIVIRRKKKDVLLQLPERIDNNYFVVATDKQKEIHSEYYDTVARLVNKWNKQKFLSEPDRKKLLLSLSCMRMVCDSTYILDQETRFDTKIDELMTLLKDIFEDKSEKVVVFSQWERMTRLVAMELDKMNIQYEYLHGGIPSIKRKDLLHNFHSKPNVRVFLSTDAGGVGLNLQCANVVINLDIPWNPAVLEQRIARVHRLGQGSVVRVINFVTLHSIEHRMLNLLNFKQALFTGVFDDGEDTVFAEENKFKKIMEVVEKITDPKIEMQATDSEQPNDKEVYGETDEKIDVLNDVQHEIPEIEPEIKEIKPIEIDEIVDDKTNQKDEITSDDSEVETKSIIEPIQTDEKESHESTIKYAAQSNENNIQSLFVSGIDFLSKLSNAFSDGNSTKNLVESLIKKDDKTGNLSLNIPIQDEKVVEKAVNVLDTFLQMFKQIK